MAAFLTKLRTVHSLGPSNVAGVLLYHASLRSKTNRAQRLTRGLPRGPYFREPPAPATDRPAPPGGCGKVSIFGWLDLDLDGAPPDWHRNVANGRHHPGAGLPWWSIPDFDAGFGDIKSLWEVSRFAWAPVFAQRARSGDAAAIARLNRWLDDWCARNPTGRGPNWKCGQEASIRVMHLAMTAVLLGQIEGIAPALAALVRVHLERIEPTIRYAMAQENNHGISEAAALFIAGNWLTRIGAGRDARRWATEGRRWLENRARRLIEEDGSFSQYSVAYHRMMLDTLCMVEIWRRALALADFSAGFGARARAATTWLAAMTQPETGDAPNIGPNDGARLLPLADSRHGDFRPSVQLASMLFLARSAYPGPGVWDTAPAWFGIDAQGVVPEARSGIFDGGGWAVLRTDSACVYVRYPRFRFRPGHADALHLDLWIAGENWLRDGGSHSYASEPEALSYFSGTRSHNTVQFDGRDQMPRLGRFLFGDWLRTRHRSDIERSDGEQGFSAGYRDGEGAGHTRSVVLSRRRLTVRDRVAGFRRSAVLRWRLLPGDWETGGDGVRCGSVSLTVGATAPVRRREIVEGWESRHYLQRSPLPVLEVEVAEECELVTVVEWGP